MPEIHHYLVTEVRTVKVSANSAVDAVQLAGAAFEYGQNSDRGIVQGKGPVGVWGNTTSEIRQRSISVEETL